MGPSLCDMTAVRCARGRWSAGAGADRMTRSDSNPIPFAAAASGPPFLKDKQGQAGILSIAPYFESGEQDELLDLNEILDRLVPLRAEILEGDLRPLYLAHLAVMSDDEHDAEETTEGPVPAGLGK